MKDILIVAAGMGTRLRGQGALKPLVDLCGRPLIEHALSAAFAAGIDRATVVVGYRADSLRAYLRDLSARRGWAIATVDNPDYRQPNGLSVRMAKGRLAGPFCLAMCDHLVEPRLYTRLIAAARKDDEVALALDRRLDNPFVDLDDVTRVCTGGRHIVDIGKGIATFNAFDTGVFAAGPALFEALEKSARDTGDMSISGGMKVLAAQHRAIGVDVGDSFWIDVDSPDMHARAAAWLADRPAAMNAHPA